jgi:hypothetical protein
VKAKGTKEGLQMDIMGVFIGATLIVLLYFTPGFIARGKKNEGGIFFLNLFLGWTFLGWVIAFIWACTSEQDEGSQRKCPYCAEAVKKEALVCKHCGHNLPVE